MNLFSREMLAESASLVGGPVEKEINWTNAKGEQYKATVYVLPMGYNTMMAQSKMGEGADVLVRRVCVSIVDPAGQAILTPADIMGDPDTGEGRMIDTLFLALLQAVNEANSYTGK